MDELEDHGQAGCAGTVALGPSLSMSHGGERGFNGIGGPQMNPVFGWEVIKRQQLFAVLGQAIGSLGILGLVGLQEQIECLVGSFPRLCLPDVVQLGFGSRLHPFR